MQTNSGVTLKGFLMLVLASVWAPALWLFVVLRHNTMSDSLFGGQLFTKYLDDYIIWPTIFLWVAAGITNLGIYSVSIRCGRVALRICSAIAYPIPVLIILITAGSQVSRGCGGLVFQWCDPRTSAPTLDAFEIIMFSIMIAFFSLPAWITAAVAKPKLPI